MFTKQFIERLKPEDAAVIARLEDSLVNDVFGALRYAYSRLTQQILGIPLSCESACTIVLWPRYAPGPTLECLSNSTHALDGWVVPDVTIRSGNRFWIVEAKLHAAFGQFQVAREVLSVLDTNATLTAPATEVVFLFVGKSRAPLVDIPPGIGSASKNLPLEDAVRAFGKHWNESSTRCVDPVVVTAAKTTWSDLRLRVDELRAFEDELTPSSAALLGDLATRLEHSGFLPVVGLRMPRLRHLTNHTFRTSWHAVGLNGLRADSWPSLSADTANSMRWRFPDDFTA